MVSTDPQLGCKDTWRGDLIVAEASASDVPTLYHTDNSHYSQYARLCLEEKGAEWRSRELHLILLEHISPWYLAISPGGCVPTLVHQGKVIPESLAILQYIDANFSPKWSLTPADTERKAAMESFIQVAYGFDAEAFTFGHLRKLNPFVGAKFQRHQRAALAELEAIAAEHPALADVAGKKIEVTRHRLGPDGIVGAEPDKLFEEGLTSLRAVLDKADELLFTGGPFLCGQQYTLADVLLTAVMARAMWNDDGKELIERSRQLADYWELVKARPSYKRADIWSGLRFSKLLDMIGRGRLAVCAGVLGLFVALTAWRLMQ